MTKIEFTEEMHQVLGFTDQAAAQGQAILAIVERDYVVQKRCPEALSPDIRCQSKEGHVSVGGEHWCRLASTGNMVSWT